MDGPLMRLRDIESRLPPGFRFHPSDQELVCYYLRGKIQSSQQLTMVEVDLHVREPWDLPVAAKLGDKEWYFFSSRDRKYATGCRTNRASRHGYWKATGKDKAIHGDHGIVMGTRKTLVFYLGRAPNGRKSDWVMHEFRLLTSTAATTPTMLEDWVLCRVFHKGKGEAGHGGSTIITSPPPALCSPAQPSDNLQAQLLSGGQLLGDDHISGLSMDDAMPDDPAAAYFLEPSEWTDAATSSQMAMGGYCIQDMEKVLLQEGYYFHSMHT